MSVLTDLIYGGSNAVAGLTENAVNDAIAKHGAEKEIAFPDTAYCFPTIYAATGVKVKTLGDLPACVGVLKSLITNQEDLGQALNAGLATAVGAEIIEGLKYLEADPYAKKIPQYSLLITTHDLYGTLNNGQLLNFCNGVTHEGKFAIISASRFVEGGVLDVERFKTVVMHEFGHLIGLTPDGRRNSYQQLGTHCSNGDIMEQDMSGTGRAMTINRLERKRRRLPPICKDCIEAGKEFFNREIQKHNEKYVSRGRGGYE